MSSTCLRQAGACRGSAQLDKRLFLDRGKTKPPSRRPRSSPCLHMVTQSRCFISLQTLSVILGVWSAIRKLFA